uniref:Uncharacterized protein n=1 Tax=Arundo donax TaxID=35708 RepID=A0A0A9DWN0_ARUDO
MWNLKIPLNNKFLWQSVEKRMVRSQPVLLSWEIGDCGSSVFSVSNCGVHMQCHWLLFWISVDANFNK